MHEPKPLNSNKPIDLIDYFEILVKHKRLILGTSLAAFIISIAISLSLPPVYNSKTRILPPQQDTGMMGIMMGQMGGGMASIASDFLGKGAPSDLYAGILASEAIKDQIIDRYKLMDVYKAKHREELYKQLENLVRIEVGKKDGIITITVEDKNPQRAADIANAFVDQLGKLNVGMGISAAKQNVNFLEERLTMTKADLVNAEDKLKKFQQQHKSLDINEQAKGTIKGIADLEGQLALEEVKLEGLRRIFTDNSSDVKNQITVTENIKKQIAKFEGGRSGSTIPGMESMPTVGQEYLRVMRKFKTQEMLVELLTKQYELAKFNASNSNSTIQVIQTARPADKKIKPKRSKIVFISTYSAFMLSILLAFIKNRLISTSENSKARWRASFKNIFSIS